MWAVGNMGSLSGRVLTGTSWNLYNRNMKSKSKGRRFPYSKLV